uniref:IKAROS family zinc finger 4 n=2 Tax=Zosterops TaxID=36298 RepID=A0A8D2PLY4_ZOSLA
KILIPKPQILISISFSLFPVSSPTMGKPYKCTSYLEISQILISTSQTPNPHSQTPNPDFPSPFPCPQPQILIFPCFFSPVSSPTVGKPYKCSSYWGISQIPYPRPQILIFPCFLSPVSSPTVGKPYKCSSCGRSYKQQSSLEEHRERCHSFLRGIPSENPSHTEKSISGKLPVKLTQKILKINKIPKRKCSTPQKFVGKRKKKINSFLPFDVSPGFDKDVEVVPARGHPLDPPYAGPLSLLGAGDPLRPLRLATNCITEVTPVISSVYTQIQALPARLELRDHRDNRDSSAASPSNGCQDSTDTESIQEERAGGGSSRHSPAYAKEEPKEEPEGAARCFPKESLRVLNEEGEQLRAFCCEHCRVLFLDHVMFTIHMGCHGFRDPFECNICGYRSQDRYEFSSHIVRGEHKI